MDKIAFHARSDIGGVSTRGRALEDRSFADEVALADGTRLFVAAVADGVGGGPAGGRAAEVALQALVDTLREGQAAEMPLALLARAVQAANAEVLAEGTRSPELHGLASTLAVALVRDRRLYVANLGDSRVMLVRAGRVRALTWDHVFRNDIVARSGVDVARAARHPRAADLVRAAGLADDARVDLGLYLRGGPLGAEPEAVAGENQGLTLLPGDRVVVCTDGLVKPRADRPDRPYVSLREIAEHVSDNVPERAVAALLSLAKGRDVDDNVSAAVLAVPSGRRCHPLRVPWALTLSVAVVAAGIASLVTALVLRPDWLTLAGR
jgi:protein phosphatase